MIEWLICFFSDFGIILEGGLKNKIIERVFPEKIKFYMIYQENP